MAHIDGLWILGYGVWDALGRLYKVYSRVGGCFGGNGERGVWCGRRREFYLNIDFCTKVCTELKIPFDILCFLFGLGTFCGCGVGCCCGCVWPGSGLLGWEGGLMEADAYPIHLAASRESGISGFCAPINHFARWTTQGAESYPAVADKVGGAVGPG